jgi:hypothetical protein
MAITLPRAPLAQIGAYSLVFRAIIEMEIRKYERVVA